MTSSASSTSRGGKIVGSRRASIVLPTPGGPTSNKWCPPAAAVASAIRALGRPRTSERSSGSSTSNGDSAWGGTSGGSGHGTSPFRHACTSPSERATRTSTPGMSAASAALSAGTITRFTPAHRSASTSDTVPGTGRTRPSSPSSPRTATSSSTPEGRPPSAHTSAIATANSSPEPDLRTDAGARFTVTRFIGYSNSEESSAARTRSRDSRPAASGKPTTV